jgi:hypothetical protein
MNRQFLDAGAGADAPDTIELFKSEHSENSKGFLNVWRIANLWNYFFESPGWRIIQFHRGRGNSSPFFNAWESTISLAGILLEMPGRSGAPKILLISTL